MAIQHLEIHQLRNLKHISLTPDPGFNLFFGKNGSGKTSLLEAIHCLGRGKSFRTHKTNQLICKDTQSFMVVGKVLHQSRQLTIGVKRHFGRNEIRMAGKNIYKASYLTEVLPIAVLDPSLHKLIEEGSERRRKFLDWGVFHVEPNFRHVWSNYRKILDQRNAALKSHWSQKQIKHWDISLVEAAESIDAYRQQYINSFGDDLALVTSEFNDIQGIVIKYQRGWKEGVDYADYLQKQFTSDRERGFTQYGPHRADLRFMLGNIEAKVVLSRGQQKVFVASLILAQCHQLARLSTPVVILVDDLPAELDADKRLGLINALKECGAQVFITATEDSLFSSANHLIDKVFHVEQGRLVDY